MVSLERKFDVLHHSIATFTRWLDTCSSQLNSLSSFQTDLESGHGEGTDEFKLRDLALQYKDMLLKIKEQCGTLQEITTLCKEIRSEAKDDHQIQRHTKAYETVGNLSQQFSATCSTAKSQYSKLSSLLQATSGARNSPGGLRYLPRSLSQTPTLGHRVSKTPPPATPPPRPSSVQTHRRALSGSHYQPVFVRPTTFSLEDREREESGGSVRRGLKFDARGMKLYDSDEDETERNHMPKAPVSSKQNLTKTVENRPKETKPAGSGPKETKSAESRPKETKTVEHKPKETKARDTKTKPAGSGPKETKTKETKAMKKVQKKQKEAKSSDNDPIPEILSLDGSPVIAGRRMFKLPSQESLNEIGSSGSTNTGHPSEKRGSPDLPVFKNRSPDRRIEQPKSSPAHAPSGSGTRVKVLPVMTSSPEHVNKQKSPPPVVKPKPSVPKKPQFLKQNTTGENSPATPGQPGKTNGKQQVNDREEEILKSKQQKQQQATNEKEEEKGKSKKASRFSKLYTFGGKKEGASKRERGGGGEEGEERGRSPPLAGSGAGTKDVDMGEWDLPGDGRESPILQGRKGVKVMLKDENMEIPVLSPRKTADSAKKKTPPPPVAKKPLGLMERITTEKKTDQSAKTTPKNTTHTKTIAAGAPAVVPGDTKTTPTTSKLTPPSPSKDSTARTKPHKPEAAGSVGRGTNTSEEAAGRLSQNKPQQLVVQTFKLDNLAQESVGSASQYTSSSRPPASLLLHREEPAKPAKPVLEDCGLLADVQRTLAASGVKLEETEEQRGKDTTTGARPSSGVIRDSDRATCKRSETGNLVPELDRESSDTDIGMELKPGYNRLSLGQFSSKSSGRYDHLSSKEPTEVKGQVNGVSESVAMEKNGRGHEEEEEEGKGQSYYIGGRGRKRWSAESPVTPLQEVVPEDGSLKGRLGYLATQLQGHIQSIAERERCSLRSLELEIHRGEVKAMLTLLEVQDFELVRLRAQFSPSCKQKFGSLVNPPAARWPEFPPEEVKKNRDEIVKLSERIQLLEKHCRDSIAQVEEVMEFVLLFEGDLKLLNEFLADSKEKLQLSREMGREHLEDAWEMLTEALAGVNGQRTKLTSVEQLSNHLLYLEPIFDGDCVRGDMHHLSTEYQGVILEVFSQLEALAHVKCEQLLMEMSVVSSWTTEAGLGLQALAKRSRQSSGVGDRIAASKESLDNGLKKHKTILLSVTKELEKITSLLSPEDHDSLRELVFHVSQVSKSLVHIEEGLEMMEFAGVSGKPHRVKGNGAKSSDSDYAEMAELEQSLKILERKQSRVLPPVPVRNVNGAKANVKETDYAHIEDLNVHGHTPKMKRKSLLKPYAQVSMKDAPMEDNDVATEATSEPPPVPKRPAVSGGDEKAKCRDGFIDLKEGQSIRDFPLPPRPDEMQGNQKFAPSPLPPPSSHSTYDTLPKSDKKSGDSASLYDVPRSLVQGESYETYDTPRNLLQQPRPLPEDTLQPRQQGGSRENTTPLPRQPDGPQDLYDVPRSVLGSSYDVYDIPRTLTRDARVEDVEKTGQSGGEPVLLSSPDDSVFSPPLYDIPRSLVEGGLSGQTSSGQIGSGQIDSGQIGSGQEQREASPEMTYDVPKSLLEPPSPLVEFNQVATRHLDRAIHRLPRSAPYRPDLEGMGEELRGKGAGLRPSSLHEELLQFIIDEWAQIPKESSPPPAKGSRLVVEETARLLEDHTHTEACLEFAREVGELEESIRGVRGRISDLRVPREPDLEKVHNGIDHCESMLSQLKKLQVFLNSCNEKSLTLLASLSTCLPHPSSHPPSPPPPPARITQSIEIWLFDLSTLLQSANLQLSTKLQELREKETLTNSLHRHLQTLSHTLSAANKLVNDRDDVIEVRGHIQQCKEMHQQLSNESDWVDQFVDEMEKYVSASPQSQACQNLLDQVKQIKEDWEKACRELALVPQLEPTLRVNMLRNVATAIKAMEKDLPDLEVTTLKLDDVIAKQRKARSLVSRCRQLLSSLQTTEVNLLQMMSPPAGNQGNHVVHPEVVGGVSPAQQQAKCRELQHDCKRIMSELKTLSSLLATSHTLLERLENETQDLRVWVDDTKAALEMGEMAVTQQHRVRFQAITQQLLAKQPAMESYQSLVSEVLLLPGDPSEKKKIEREVLALYTDWDAICHQCVPAGTLPLMSPTTPQSALFQAPQEFEDPSQMVEWLIMLDFKLQPERLVVGDFLHVRRALRDLQLIEAELQSKERIYNHFMKDIEPNAQDNETETQFNEVERERSNSPSPAPLSAPLEDSGEFNPQQGVNVDRSPERRRRRFENLSGMESVQEQSEDEGDGTVTPRISEPRDHSNNSTPSHTVTKVTPHSLTSRRQLSMETTSTAPKISDRFPKQPSLPLLLSHSSLPHGLPTPPSSLSSTQQQLTPPHSLLSSLSSVENGSRSLLSRQVSITSSITASLAELLVAGSPGASMPEDLYQLKLLWSGMKSAIEQKRQRLERIRDLWTSFEEKKEEFVRFLSRGETRLREFPMTLAEAKDLGVIQNEIETQKAFLEEIPAFERKLSVLNELGQDLVTHYHDDDSTADLQDVLQDINKRWTVVMESVARHQPEVNLLSRQWVEFHTHYQSFHQWLRNMDTDMANLNPLVTNMATVQMQLIKLKEIQEELKAHEGVLDSVKLLSYKLQQDEGRSCHVNPAAIHSRLESASRRWDHLQKLAQERHSALEDSLTNKQQLLTRMADCLSWLQQAEQHMMSQKPLGGDYYQIHNQFIAHQSFGREVQEQTPKMEAVIQAGRSGLLDVQWPLGTPERSRMDSLRSEFSAVERRWSKVRMESEEWGKLLESLHPEMEAFQTLCAECGQRLSEVELRANGMPPVANRVVMLTQQLEELREFEAGLVVVGNVLERVIGTQKKLIQLGARVSSELVELVRRFHERWVEVKKRVTNRYSTIDKAMVKYDPENLGVATLPRGWIREKTRNGTPYYVENKRDATYQWQHPELTQLYQSMESEYNQPCYPNLAYPAALKLRNLQKKTQLHLLETRIAMQTFEEDHIYNIYNSHKSLTSADMIMLCLGLFEQAERRPSVKTEPLYVNRAVELTAAWIRDVYDITHEGSVTCVSFQIAMVSLSQGRLEEKQRCLFQLIARNSETITLHQLTDFLEHLVQIPQNVLQTQYCSVDSLDYHAQDCFRKFSDEAGQLSLPQFLSWAQTEPLPLSWLAVMHRAAAAETTHHDVRCAVCRSGPPISGFRYRCQQCHNYDMCQGCFWSGGTTHGHDRTKHYMEEYCVVRPSGDDLKDFFRNLQRHMKKRKKKASSGATPEVLQEHAPQIIGDHSPVKSSGGRTEGVKQSSPAVKQRHATVSVSSEGGGDPLRKYTSPTPQTTPIKTGGSPSHRPAAGASGGSQREKRDGAVHDVDFSLVKITEEDKNVSQTLDTLRRHRESLSSDLTTPMTTPLRVGNGPAPLVTTGNKPRPPAPVSSALENRVRVLEDHNTRLEGYISQLKQVTTNPQIAAAPLQSISSSNRGPPHPPAANGSPAHLTPRGNPYIRPERKYHYITVTTPNPAHKTNSQYTTTAASSHPVATTTTGSPAHSNYVPLSPAHQRMVLQPPALVRNNRHRNPATTLL